MCGKKRAGLDINGDVHRANWGDKQAKTWWLVEPSILRIVQVLNRAKRSVSHGTNKVPL